MRLRGFFVGTVVGALAARYLMQGGRMSQVIPGMAGVGTGMGRAMGQMMFSRASAGKESGQGGKGLGQVGEMLNRDPAVKAQVNEILRENREKAEELH